MKRYLIAVCLGFIVAHVADAREYLLFHNADLKPPRLGDGFDPVRRSAERVRPSALALAADLRRSAALQANVSIRELTQSANSVHSTDAAANTALEHVLQAELRMQESTSIFENHSVFVVQALLVNHVETTANANLLYEAAELSEDAFRQRHGSRVIERIDYGGHIFLIYVFRTRKDEVRRKIISSMQAAYADVSEKASFTNYLEKSGVSTEFTMYSLQDGGELAPFLNPNLAEFRNYLERWTPSVAKRPTPVRFYTTRYHEVIPDFPHRWILGFGKTYRPTLEVK